MRPRSAPSGNRSLSTAGGRPLPACRQRTPASGPAPGLPPHGRRQTPSPHRPLRLRGSGFRSAAGRGGFPHCCWTAPSSETAYFHSASRTPYPLSGFRCFQERGAGSRPVYRVFGNRRSRLSWFPAPFPDRPASFAAWEWPAGRPAGCRPCRCCGFYQAALGCTAIPAYCCHGPRSVSLSCVPGNWNHRQSKWTEHGRQSHSRGSCWQPASAHKCQAGYRSSHGTWDRRAFSVPVPAQRLHPHNADIRLWRCRAGSRKSCSFPWHGGPRPH